MKLGLDGREIPGGVRTGIGRYVTAVIEGAQWDGIDCVVDSDRALPRLEGQAGVTVRIVPRGPLL